LAGKKRPRSTDQDVKEEDDVEDDGKKRRDVGGFGFGGK
jgi:hypothetical protein